MLIYLIIKSEHDYCNTWSNIEGAYLDQGSAEYNCSLLEEENIDPQVTYFVDPITVDTSTL